MVNRNEIVLRNLAFNLKHWRKIQGFTQEDLAYNSGLALSQIARIETCRINPTILTLSIIVDTLGIKLSDLLSFETKTKLI